MYDIYPELDLEISEDAKRVIEIRVKYADYIQRMQDSLQKQNKLAEKKIPDEFDYSYVKGLKKESSEKLVKIRPMNIGQASRIDGVSPADIAVLVVAFKKVFLKEEALR